MFTVVIDYDRSYYEAYHVSCFAQVSTSKGLFQAVCMTDKYALFLIFDESQKKFIEKAKNPSGSTSFLGGYNVEGTTLVIIRDTEQVSVFNVETAIAQTISKSPFLETSKSNTFNIERQGDLLTIDLLEFDSSTKTSSLRRLQRSVYGLLTLTKK
jgi:hypothetical protein